MAQYELCACCGNHIETDYQGYLRDCVTSNDITVCNTCYLILKDMYKTIKEVKELERKYNLATKFFKE